MVKNESDEKEVVTGSNPFQGIGIVTVSPIRGVSANSSSKWFQSNPQKKLRYQMFECNIVELRWYRGNFVLN